MQYKKDLYVYLNKYDDDIFYTDIYYNGRIFHLKNNDLRKTAQDIKNLICGQEVNVYVDVYQIGFLMFNFLSPILPNVYELKSADLV